ncbi:MAG: nucleoside phosphorylase [Bacteroidetes bacterium]|nr:nucleoside phosphorylase [Bacteroidota bacterium]
MPPIKNADLLINPDGSIYHLALRPEQIADTVIIVGDPERVTEISHHFDSIECKTHNREFITHTGLVKGKRISVLSTGIGTDNIDIVMNELDALANINLSAREIKPDHRALTIIRLGTSGAIQPDVPVGAFALSSYGLGLDNLMHFYANGKDTLDLPMADAFMKHTGWNADLSRPYFVRGSEELVKKFERGTVKGITATAPGFYGPQGRILRIGLADPDLNEKIRSFRYNGERIINFEMETSALYGLGRLLGHHIMTVCALIANRATNETSPDHKALVRKLIEFVLERITDQQK